MTNVKRDFITTPTVKNVTVILLVLRRSLVIPLVDVERSSKVVSVSAKRGSLVASVIYVNLATGISTGITFLDVKRVSVLKPGPLLV